MSKEKVKRLTGKQASFVDKYLGEARFNASLAARLAGYKATSKHSFEAIGSENLTKLAIATAINEYWRMSRMSAEECLDELSKLARGDSKDKVRALALLTSHYGLLDGAGSRVGRGGDGPIDIRVTYTNEVTSAMEKVYGRQISNEERAERMVEIVKTVGQWHEEATEFNDHAAKNNERIENTWSDLRERYKDVPEVIEALAELHRAVHQGCETDPCVACKQEAEKQQPFEPEIVPPERHLQPAPIEKLMREVPDEVDQTVTLTATPQDVARAVQTEHVTTERVRAFGYCQPIDGEEVDRIKERDRDRFHHEIRLY